MQTQGEGRTPGTYRTYRSTSIRDIKSVATTFRFGSIPAVSMAAARETIKRHRLIKDVTYIFYNVPELQHIEAYDARDPERYV
jgi:hypothetical protein